MLTGLLAGVVGLSACTSEPVDPCQVQPTRVNEQGQCVEFDDELCDADPCDSDDLSQGADHSKPKKPKSTKPGSGKKGFK